MGSNKSSEMELNDSGSDVEEDSRDCSSSNSKESVTMQQLPSPFDPNNNCVSNDTMSRMVVDSVSEEQQQATDDLVETINSRLLAVEKNQSKGSDKSHRVSELNGDKVAQRGSKEATVESDEDESEYDDDDGQERGKRGVTEEEEPEPYDVDKVLISTFLAHTNEIVRNLSRQIESGLIN